MNELRLGDKKLAQHVKKIQNAIRKKVDEAGAKGVVVGLSGGVDSAVVATLASGVVDTTALIMPDEITDKKDIKNAEGLAKKLGIEYEIVKIEGIWASVNEDFPFAEFDNKNKKISLGNVKARVRMMLLYLTANLDNRLVLGTGNRSEILLGYCTKYGDAGVDFLPIGDLYKTQVRELAEYLEVPKRIREKIPTAGLWRGQTDEAEIGMDYGTLDKTLYCLVNKKLSVAETAKKLDRNIGDIIKIKRRIDSSAHKREMPRIVKL